MNKISASLLLIGSLTTVLGGALSGCGSQPMTPTSSQPQPAAQMKTTDQVTANQPFHDYSEQFIEQYWQLSPTSAMHNGYHKYDHLLPIPDEASRQQTMAFVKHQRQLLSKIPLATLNTNEQTDYYLITNQLDELDFAINRYKSYQWDPSRYNVASGFAQIFNGNYDSLDNRLLTALQRAENIPLYYQVAKANITNPTLEHTELAILQNQGGLSLFSDPLREQIQNSGLTAAQKTQFYQRIDAGKAAINDYIQWLEQLKTQLEQQPNVRSFRLGESLYEEKFKLNIQSQYSAKTIYEKAMADMNTINGKLTAITQRLWPKYLAHQPMPADNAKATAALIKHLSVQHVKREDFVSEIRQQIPALAAFIKQHDLITLDPEQPLVVRETPAYMRGFAGASISAPGPYDQKENTYYNVTPLDGMNDQQAESYLNEYNRWMLQILNIHEAIPGHYAQLVYANKSPSLIKAILGNGAMIEGWAVYTERMMLEEGYGNNEDELWLMYYKWNLRVISNTILDYSVHVNGMTKSQALDLLMNKAFQEQAEAEGKWRRVTLSQVQLTSYYAGYREIYDFREELKAKQGQQFDLKQFHETFLSYGSAPVKYIKELMRQAH